MGTIRDDNDDKVNPVKNNSAVDISISEVHPFDSQFDPSSFSDGESKGEDAYELQFLQSTAPFYDTIPAEDAFETQVVDLGGETQVLDDLDSVENIGTQSLDDCDTDVVVDSDGEGTDRTEVLCDAEELSDEDSGKRLTSDPVDQENMLHNTLCEQGDGVFREKSYSSSNEERGSGSVHRRYTSVRVASIRASGLEARSKAFKETNSGSCSIMSGSLSLKQHTTEYNDTPLVRDSSQFGEDVDQEHAMEESDEQMKGSRNENRCRVGSSTVRKLFTDDAFAEIKGPDDNMDNADEGANFPRVVSEIELAGLSYVNSQEPGESSQANALDFVDRFLKVNIIEFDHDIDFRNSNRGKSKPVSSAKGAQSLAKRVGLRSAIGERGIFDWDDNREDEGGGEFFRKKKEALFDNGDQRSRSFNQSRKPRCLDSKDNRAVEESRDKKRQVDIQEKTMGLVYTDSRSMLHNLKQNDESAEVTKAEFKKNLIKDLNEQLNVGCSDGIIYAGSDKDVEDTMNIGFDTQMAAEAMEALCVRVSVTEHKYCDANQGAKNMRKDSPESEPNNRTRSPQNLLQKGTRSSKSGVIARQSRQRKISKQLSKEHSRSSVKQSKRKQHATELVQLEPKRTRSDAKYHFATNVSEGLSKVSSKIIERKKAKGALERSDNEIDGHHLTVSNGRSSVKKQHFQEQFDTFIPIACRTRQANQSKRVGNASNDVREEMNDLTRVGAHSDKRRPQTGGDTFTMLNTKDKSTIVGSFRSRTPKNVKSAQHGQSDPKLIGTTSAVKIDTLDYPRGRRTHQRLSSVGKEANARLKTDVVSTLMDLGVKRKTRSSMRARPFLPSLDMKATERLLLRSVDNGNSGDTVVNCSSATRNGNAILQDVAVVQASNNCDRKSDADITASAEGAEANAMSKVSPRERYKLSDSVCATPVICKTPINAASPIRMGDEYVKQSCRRNLLRSSLMKEISSLIATGPEPKCAIKDSRRRRDMASVRVLFSQHLDGDVIKQQKKILARLGASVASSISDATHFITDKFVRTRNMLEAIAFGKPVVTQLWLESCGQANCLIDERKHILRDAKKEKEFGFSMPVSLDRASQQPLLQGQRVLITPNTKPGKEILASLVKAVHGLAVERICRSALMDDKVPDDLLVLSCEEDYPVCMPFLEIGAAVYSSELLLNGIVTQKLEYERHRLFADHVKSTRSTIWLKQSNQYLPVTKCK